MTSKSTPDAQDTKNHGKRPAVAGSLIAGLAAVATAGLIAACSGGSSSASAGAGSTQGSGGGTQQAAAGLTISSRQVSGAGTVLTNQAGRTLYTPEQEASGSIKCTGSCLSFWFPVTMAQGATPHAASGVTGKLGSVKRPDNGDLQLTYNGDPLYTFRLDGASGQAHGNNFTDSFGGQTFLWHVATVGGAAPAGAQPSNPSGNSGYNYQGGGY
jgi:predicted lipoprotein with Yx(FWY)xxD motif